MNFNPQKKATGVCAACGRPTRLLVHQNCGKKLQKAGAPQRKRTKRKRVYKEAFIKTVLDK